MKSSTHEDLFNKKTEIITASKQSPIIKSVSLYKPIRENWEQYSSLSYFLISLTENQSLIHDEELNTFQENMEKILGEPCGLFLRPALEQQLKSYPEGSEIKQEMQERLDYHIPLEELTAEPWLVQFKKKKEAVLRQRLLVNAPTAPVDITKEASICEIFGNDNEQENKNENLDDNSVLASSDKIEKTPLLSSERKRRSSSDTSDPQTPPSSPKRLRTNTEEEKSRVELSVPMSSINQPFSGALFVNSARQERTPLINELSPEQQEAVRQAVRLLEEEIEKTPGCYNIMLASFEAELEQSRLRQHKQVTVNQVAVS
jgi:hypothetical protein